MLWRKTLAFKRVLRRNPRAAERGNSCRMLALVVAISLYGVDSEIVKSGGKRFDLFESRSHEFCEISNTDWLHF
jgi:hypothetical protein